MKKYISILLGSLLALLLIGCGNQVDEATADKYLTKAKEVAENLTNGNYEAIHSQFGASMKANLSIEQMAEIAPIIEASGDFEKFDKESIEEKDGNYITVLVAKYSEEKRVYTISFNAEDEIVGLFVK